MLTNLNLSCNNFTMFPLEAVLSQKLISLDLSTNKVHLLSHVYVRLGRNGRAKNFVYAVFSFRISGGMCLVPKFNNWGGGWPHV